MPGKQSRHCTYGAWKPIPDQLGLSLFIAFFCFIVLVCHLYIATLFQFNYFYFVNVMSKERRRAAGEDRSQVQPPALEESNNDPLERLMTRWLEADGRRMQREDQRREEDLRLQAQQQERWANSQLKQWDLQLSNHPPIFLSWRYRNFRKGLMTWAPSWKYSKWQRERDDGQKSNGIYISEPHYREQGWQLCQPCLQNNKRTMRKWSKLCCPPIKCNGNL